MDKLDDNPYRAPQEEGKQARDPRERDLWIRARESLVALAVVVALLLIALAAMRTTGIWLIDWDN